MSSYPPWRRFGEHPPLRDQEDDNLVNIATQKMMALFGDDYKLGYKELFWYYFENYHYQYMFDAWRALAEMSEEQLTAILLESKLNA